jgi:hypothetical protein
VPNLDEDNEGVDRRSENQFAGLRDHAFGKCQAFAVDGRFTLNDHEIS